MFNMPFQLSHPSIIESPDDADCADVSIVDVQPGDVVVMATDGEGNNETDMFPYMVRNPVSMPMVRSIYTHIYTLTVGDSGGRFSRTPLLEGLYDNVFDEEIAQIVVDALKSRRQAPTRAMNKGDAPPSPASEAHADMLRDRTQLTPHTTADAEYVAMSIARTAHSYAQKTHQRTPWSVSACETGMPWARFFVKGGGKMDDVTVVVGFVVEDPIMQLPPPLVV